jgi:polysaccharide export outer membrane protein
MRIRDPILIGLLGFLVFLALFPHECQSEGGYVIGPGDTLMIRVWGDDDLTRDVVVSPEGSFRFPLIGEVEAAGRSVEDLRRVITERLADGYLVDPQVEIVIRAYRSRNVFVLGEVVRPGTYPLDTQTSVIEIISTAGGLAEGAGDVAQIIRGRKGWSKDKPLTPDQEAVGQVIQVDLRGLLTGKGDSEDVEIHDGDTIFVPKGQVFYIFGEVGQPGKYRWERGLTVLKAVIVAGGFTEIASKRRIKIRRNSADGEEKIRAKLDALVEPDDTVIVPESFF